MREASEKSQIECGLSPEKRKTSEFSEVWLGWTKMNPQPNLQPKNSGFMRLSRFVLSEKSPLNKNETTFHPPGGELFSFSFLVDFMRLFLFWCQPASNPHCSFFHSDRDTQYTAFAFRKLLKTSM